MSIFSDPTIIPGKTLDQPYAGAVWLAAMGYPGKDIETRDHRFNHVGKQIVICAGLKRQATPMVPTVVNLLDRGVPRELVDRALAFSGVALVLATVSECRPLLPEDFARAFRFEPGLWAWILDDIKPLRPFPVRGVPGFCKVPRERVEQAIREAA